MSAPSIKSSKTSSFKLLTLIGKSWKTHPEIFLKPSFSGSSKKPFYFKTHPVKIMCTYSGFLQFSGVTQIFYCKTHPFEFFDRNHIWYVTFGLGEFSTKTACNAFFWMGCSVKRSRKFPGNLPISVNGTFFIQICNQELKKSGIKVFCNADPYQHQFCQCRFLQAFKQFVFMNANTASLFLIHTWTRTIIALSLREVTWNAPKSMRKMIVSCDSICIIFLIAPKSENFIFGHSVVV